MFNPEKTSATSCQFTFIPSTVTRNTADIKVEIKTADLVPGTYRYHMFAPKSSSALIDRFKIEPDGTGNFTRAKTVTGWNPGTYEIYLVNDIKKGNIKDIFECKGSFNVSDEKKQQCSLSIENQNIDPSTDVVLSVGGTLSPSNDNGLNTGGYDVNINGKYKFTYSTNVGPRISLGMFTTGDYTVELRERCGLAGLECSKTRPPALVCSAAAFRVVGRGEKGGGSIKPEEAQIVTNVCIKNPQLCSAAGGQRCPDGTKGIMTAVGCVPTQPKEFVEGLLKYVTLAAGGIAFIMMILAALQMITAEGNPEAIKEGQEKFYSAIIGLLLIVFSVLLMQVIGVDILGLKGFVK